MRDRALTPRRDLGEDAASDTDKGLVGTLDAGRHDIAWAHVFFNGDAGFIDCASSEAPASYTPSTINTTLIATNRTSVGSPPRLAFRPPAEARGSSLCAAPIPYGR